MTKIIDNANNSNAINSHPGSPQPPISDNNKITTKNGETVTQGKNDKSVLIMISKVDKGWLEPNLYKLPVGLTKISKWKELKIVFKR